MNDFPERMKPMHSEHELASGGHGALKAATPAGDDRPMRPAMLKGWHRKCPACGEGALLEGYLKVRDTCPACGEAMHHQRADDGPAYLTILIVGKLMVPPFYWAFLNWRPDPLLLALVFSLGTVLASLWLLPRLKGVMVGIQWSRRMHGFGGADG